MAGTIEKGITITFRGETVEFDKSVDGVNKGLKALRNEASQVNKQLKLDPTNTDLLAKKFENLRNQQKLLKEQLANYQRELDGMDKKDVGSKKWLDLQKNIGNVETQLAGVNKKLEQEGKTTDKVVEKTEELNSSLLQNGANIGGLVIAFEKLYNVASKVVDAMTSIITDSASMADEVNTLAKQYNLSTKQIQLYMKASDLVDVELNTITKSMSKLTKNMTSTSTGVISAFKQLGVATKNSDGSLRDSNEVFNEIIASLGKIEDETLQDSLAMEVFGKSASDLGPLINGGAEQLAELNKYLEENSLLLSQDELDALNKVNDSFDTINMTWDAVKEKIASQVAPVIQPILDSFTENVEKIKPKIDGLVDKLVNFISEHQEGISQFIDDVFTWITSEETTEFFDDLFDMFDEMADFITNLGLVAEKLGIIDFLCSSINKAIENISSLMHGLNDLLTGNTTLKELMQKGIIKGLLEIMSFGNKAVDFFTGGSLGFGNETMMSGGFSSGGIVLNNTINVNNNGSDISVSQINGWADIMTNRINENLGRLI